MRSKRRGGFTLIELVVVIALITTMAAILFPVFALAREAARRTTCLSNLRQIAAAHRMYVEEYDEALPFWWINSPAGPVAWTEYLRPYYRSPQILDQHFYGSNDRASWRWLADYTLCAWGPFGNNTLANPYGRYPGSIDFNRGAGRGQWLTMAEVRRPAETLQFADGITTSGTDTWMELQQHNGVLNGAFLDGHASRIGDELLYRVDNDVKGYFYHIAAADR
jgi:prepilin-type N-terminal cleavage/methylation domain-containing protein/prepilin-type processing-associated H-X9-DG protein